MPRVQSYTKKYSKKKILLNIFERVNQYSQRPHHTCGTKGTPVEIYSKVGISVTSPACARQRRWMARQAGALAALVEYYHRWYLTPVRVASATFFKPCKIIHMSQDITTRIVGFSKNNTYAMIKLSANAFDCCPKTVYIPAKAVEGKKVGDDVTIPSGWSLTTKEKDGEVMTFSDGVAMQFLTYA